MNGVYHCPVSKRYLDPYKAWRLLWSLSANKINEWILNNDPQRFSVARQVLDLPEIDPTTGAGYTEDLVDTALNTFAGYLEKKGSRVSSSPSSPPCTACPHEN